jgi:mannose/fructose/N-acetylgalactosamine-specific phosphotransferase system component IID
MDKKYHTSFFNTQRNMLQIVMNNEPDMKRRRKEG